MGVTIPSSSNFTSVLRETVRASAEKGYSRNVEPYQGTLAALRLAKDPTLERERVVQELGKRGAVVKELGRAVADWEGGVVRFFPGGGQGTNGSRGGTGQGSRGGTAGRGTGRGRGRGY